MTQHIPPVYASRIAAALAEFTVRSRDDILRLVHEPCGTPVCMIEAGDEMSLLVMTTIVHECQTAVPPRTSTAEQRQRLLDELLGDS